MPLNKELGYVLSIDPGSNALGLALWHDGNFIASTVCQSTNARQSYSRRIQTILPQIQGFLTKYVGNETITCCVSEGVRSRLVQVALGAVLSDSHIDATLSPTGSFVESSSWKSWAKKHGATGPLKDIKGIKALKETGWNAVEGMSDDEADAILIYQTWRDR